MSQTLVRRETPLPTPAEIAEVPTFLHGLMAEFEEHDRLLEAAKRAYQTGPRRRPKPEDSGTGATAPLCPGRASESRRAPVGHFFNVISSGYGIMYSYGDRVPPSDRWAITAYIRALQLSQSATLEDLPPTARAQLEQTR